MVLNTWILYLMNRLRINQRNWPGKDSEATLYNARGIKRPLEA